MSAKLFLFFTEGLFKGLLGRDGPPGHGPRDGGDTATTRDNAHRPWQGSQGIQPHQEL